MEIDITMMNVLIAGAGLVATNLIALAIGRGWRKYHSKEDEERHTIMDGIKALTEAIKDIQNDLSEMKGLLKTTEADLKGRIQIVDNKAEMALRVGEKNEKNILEYMGKGIKR